MANIRKWMADARRLEQKGDLQGAIATYRKALVAQEETSGFADLGLINGLGDLYRRAGLHQDALEAYERAAAQCEDQQLYANGIALCKKILRNAPGATAVYRRVGRLYALSGLMTDARASYEAYMERLAEEGREPEVREAQEELIALTGGEDVALDLADALVEDGRDEEALSMLRSVRDRRERDGRGVVGLIRRIQELAGFARYVTRDPEPRKADSGPGVLGSDGTDHEGFDEHDVSDIDPESLTRELKEVLSRVEGEERFRRALPIIDHLLEIEPGRFDLLHRKLGYAFEAADEEAIVSAYLALGEWLNANLEGFKLRSLSTSTESGSVTAAIKVERLADLVPGS